MIKPPEGPRFGGGAGRPEENVDSPILAEDLLLLLFQPDSGTIAGENTLFDVLAGAVLADLALHESVIATTTGTRGVVVEAIEGQAPSDDILHSAWDYVSDRPRGVQTILPAIGPKLRQPLLERLVARGDIREESRKVLGVLKATVLKGGRNGRRARLLEDVREVLVGGVEPTPRVAALAALVWGSGTLSKFDPDIPWTAPVLTRARELETGNWVTGTAAEARTVTSIIVNSVIVAVSTLPRN